MNKLLLFSAGRYTFGISTEDIERIEFNSEKVDLSKRQVQNLNSVFGTEAKEASSVGCWIFKKDGNALGVSSVIGFGEVEVFELPEFIKQNILVGAIKRLGRCQSRVIFIFENGEGSYGKLSHLV